MELGTSRIKKYLKLINNPQMRLKIIHVTGTNGKGSVCKLLTNILVTNKNRFNIGTFNSPALINPFDSIQINNKSVKKELYEETISEITKKSIQNNINLTIFEKEVVAAVIIFLKFKCKLCIFEVGMGGLDDATNIFDNILMLLVTSISFDHVKYIGPTIEDIIKNKLSLAKSDSPVLMAEQDDIFDENKIIKGSYIENFSKKIIPWVTIVKKSKIHEEYYIFKYEDVLIRYKLELEGEFQATNSALALYAFFTLKKIKNEITESISIYDVERACENTKHWGRLTWINNILIDGSHNPAAMIQLKKYVENKLKVFTKKIIWIMAISENKDYKSMILNLFINELKNEQQIILTKFTTPVNMSWVKCLDPEILAVYLKQNNIDFRILSFNDVMDNIIDDKNIYIFCGSLYLVRDVLKYFISKKGLLIQ